MCYFYFFILNIKKYCNLILNLNFIIIIFLISRRKIKKIFWKKVKIIYLNQLNLGIYNLFEFETFL